MTPLKISFLFSYLLLLLEDVLAAPHLGDSRKLNLQRKDDATLLARRSLEATQETFPVMVNALEVMQSEFWDQATGIWPTGIDWTSAVFSTHISATLNVMATYEATSYESEIEKYFSQVVSFYSGENVTALLGEKFDDMQWVVLEWLEAINFVDLYSSIDPSFNGRQYIPEFAHRARIFWDLASQGYNTTLCGGGMLWTDQLAPYKNAITNELYVASSIGMYLYFPGDNNPNPYPVAGVPYNSSEALSPVKPHDQRYLNAAIKEYDWLSTSNMTNSQGLYVDGFHITGYVNATDFGTGKCDSRDESVYTYNQGVLLSGLRGLWDATGQMNYLNDGYTLVRNVIAATGWTSNSQTTSTWSGLGSDGILQDFCDVDGSCSQDAQAFKGIFFHHLTLFCQPLNVGEKETNGFIFNATASQAQSHQNQCASYTPWIEHNAQAAYRTRNATGVYGEWWDAPPFNSSTAPVHRGQPQPQGASDYRNKGIPQNSLWRLPSNPSVSEVGMTPVANTSMSDPNDRGRGRTVETQSGGLGVMRCLAQAEEES